MLQDLENYELSFSVQIDGQRLLELLVDELETGEAVWRLVDNAGRVLERSDAYECPAHCLRDGLNHALPA